MVPTASEASRACGRSAYSAVQNSANLLDTNLVADELDYSTRPYHRSWLTRSIVGFSLVLLGGAAAVWLRSDVRRLRSQFAVEVKMQSVDCTTEEARTAASGDACRARCDEDSKCAAWSWRMEHSKYTCFLKSIGQVAVPVGHAEFRVLSQLPCHEVRRKAAMTVVSAAPKVAIAGIASIAGPSSSSASLSAFRRTSNQTMSLFCFALMRPSGYELELVRMQYHMHASLFGCDAYRVYSNVSLEIAPSLQTSVVATNLDCKFDGLQQTVLNTQIFLVVWKEATSSGLSENHDWTVKVDPDCIFFPGRLRNVLRKHPDPINGVYLNNCKYGLHGPFEALSRNAVRAWSEGAEQCSRHFIRQCQGFCKWGENMFLDQCLHQVLHVQRDRAFDLLSDEHCDPPDGWDSCKSRDIVGFHPFKTEAAYRECLLNAGPDTAEGDLIEQLPTSTIVTTSSATTTQYVVTTTAVLVASEDLTTLFCYALMMPGGYEKGLLILQYNEKTSIFGCDCHTVYSNVTLDLAPGVKTSVVESDLHCRYGGEFYTALNTDIFIAVWKQVIADGEYERHDWTVKVDPDCVFFPDRLRTALTSHSEVPQGTYLNNCKYGLHGPFEVFSRNAVHAWGDGMQKCKAHFNRSCDGPCQWGEDMFIDQCLWKVLDVRRDDHFGLLTEDHCDPPKDWDSCQDPRSAAFHPFKDIEAYKICLDNARAGRRQIPGAARHDPLGFDDDDLWIGSDRKNAEMHGGLIEKVHQRGSSAGELYRPDEQYTHKDDVTGLAFKK